MTPAVAPQVPTEGHSWGRVLTNDSRRDNGGKVKTHSGRSGGVDRLSSPRTSSPDQKADKGLLVSCVRLRPICIGMANQRDD